MLVSCLHIRALRVRIFVRPRHQLDDLAGRPTIGLRRRARLYAVQEMLDLGSDVDPLIALEKDFFLLAEHDDAGPPWAIRMG